MNQVLALPLELRLVLFFVLGVGIGSFLNLAIFRLAFTVRDTSPWSRRSSPNASWLDLLPVIGWLRAKPNARLGTAYWVRPLCIEIGTGLCFAWLYWWEVDQRALLSLKDVERGLPFGVWPPPGGSTLALHLMYESHLLLLCLMIVATFIDIDDRIIPDSITIPGTLAGLLVSALVPWSLLPSREVALNPAGPWILDFLKLTSPQAWRSELGPPNLFPLWAGLACYWGWCFALLPRHWRARRGLKTACRIFVGRMLSEPITYLILVLAVLGTPLVYLAWRVGGPHWAGLLTALVGMAASGGLVWLIRIAGSVAMGREAMGFGDVTLMAMVGAFLGWQAGVLIFFVAPFCALLIGIGNWILRREQEIPYGPFLCLGCLVVIARWSSIWIWAQPLLQLGGMLLVVAAIAFVLLAAILFAMRWVRNAIEAKSSTA